MIPAWIKNKCDYCDLRVYKGYSEGISFVNGKLDRNSVSSNEAYGARVFLRGSWGLASSNKKEELGLIFEKAYKLAKISSQNSKLKFSLNNIPTYKDKKIIKPKKDPRDIELSEKVQVMRELDKIPKTISKDTSTNTVYNFWITNKKIYNSFGLEIEQEIPYTGVWCSLSIKNSMGGLVKESTRSSSISGFESSQKFGHMIEKATKKLEEKKDYSLPPQGNFNLLLGKRVTGLLFHEGVGHACEADAILQNASVLKSKFNKKIANEKINLYSNPHIKEGFGFYYYDDEGVRAKKTKLIDKGILVGYMHNLETSSRMNVKPTGNARSGGVVLQIIPRMNNLEISPGEYSKKELMENVKNGYYVDGFGGGIVNPVTGEFSFKVGDVLEIKNSKINKRYREATLSGNVVNTLKNISAIGKSRKLYPDSSGFCGKMGQTAEVDEKVPDLVVKRMKLG